MPRQILAGKKINLQFLLKEGPKWMTACLNEIRPVITQNPVPSNMTLKAVSNQAYRCQSACWVGYRVKAGVHVWH